MKRTIALALFLISVAAVAQQPSDGPHANLLANLQARQLGPTNMGGRVSDLAVVDKDPRIFYVATASGGLWKTTNLGLTFEPVFDKESTVSLGAVAVNQDNPNEVWVGTGEGSNRNSVAWGDGVYKSSDGGKTWTHVGLRETHQISKILIDPKNPNTVYVGALGRLWGPNPERGVYKTTDGGKTWEHVLKVDPNTGVIDLDMDPKNPRTLIASMYERRRFAYDFVSGGPGSGLYRTTDAGKNWRKIEKVPAAPLGRIGVSYFAKDPKVLVATFEHRPEAAAQPATTEGGQGQRGPSGRGGGTYRSYDGGETWVKMSSHNPRPFYFSMPVQDPVDKNRVYVPHASLSYSDDEGKTFKTMGRGVHPDYHAWWIHPTDSNFMICGNDGGVYVTHDRGENWRHLNNLPIGQFYAVAVDMRKPYWVYGGLQDNGSWGLPTQTVNGGPAFWDARNTSGGDGFHVQVDPEDWETVYTESQGGAVQRVNMRTGQGRGIRPQLQGQTLRWNWSTPFIISPHNHRTLYIGGNRLFKSVNRGDAWRVISPDLTTNDPVKTSRPGQKSVTPEDTGAERHCTIITISESPRRQGLLYVGTDDGLVQVSQDDGATWTNVTANIPDLPANTWCSRVTASKWEDGRVYASFDGHRSDDFRAYVYVSEDFGKTWKKITNGLPDDPVYVIKEGHLNKDLLYLGSEHALRMSFDRGQSWTRFRSNFPTVAVHDLVVHPRDLDLVIGTHGRAIWNMDVSGLEQLTSDVLAKDAALFKPQNVLMLGRVGNAQQWSGEGAYVSPNTQPGTRIQYYLKQPATEIKLVVSDITGQTTRDLTPTNLAGLNSVAFNGRVGGRLEPGIYRVTLSIDGKDYVNTVTVEDIPAADVSGIARE